MCLVEYQVADLVSYLPNDKRALTICTILTFATRWLGIQQSDQNTCIRLRSSAPHERHHVPRNPV